jgi:hypothetical protein
MYQKLVSYLTEKISHANYKHETANVPEGKKSLFIMRYSIIQDI